MSRFNRMKCASPLSLGLLLSAISSVVGIVGCGGPSTSSSSHWIRCSSDADCDNFAVDAVCGGEGYCVASEGSKIEQRLVFEDEFDDPMLDLTAYGFETGFSVRNGDAEYYTDRPENAFVEDGELVLVARAEAFEEAEYTSASIETRGLRSWTYGRIEARMLAPVGRGASPALWMLPERPGAPVRVCSDASTCSEGDWPAWGDIVIMAVRSERPDEVLHTASYATWDATLGELVRGQGGGTSLLDTSVASAYHDYAVVWGPRRIEWYLDDELCAAFDISDQAIHSPEGRHPFREPFHLKLSLAVGGLSEAPVAEDYPQQMRVAWLRIWEYR